MVLRNDHVLKLFNGDIGISLPDEQGELMVYFADAAGGLRAVAPVRLPVHQTAFAMTVHKSQGQTLDKVGIFFPRPTWAHGLLYVAVSRVRRTQDCFWLGEYGGTIHNFCSKHVL